MNIGTFGNYLLLFAGLCHLISVFLRISRVKIYTFVLAEFLTIASYFVLVWSFISSNFAIRNVFFNSSTIIPWWYKIASSWSSHEGSMLLWLALLSSVSLLYFYSSRYFSKDAQSLQISVLSFVQLLFVSFVYVTSNPFAKFTFAPSEGLGLNPMLQDTAVMIHPPALYLGYVSYIALFVNSLLSISFSQKRREFDLSSKFFSSLALMFTTFGIALGSWWAYRELGWGGYWFFDPVENISILPWMAGIIAHHFLLITIKSGKYRNWALCFSILPFLVSIYGMFFVRSGVISSVHAFAFSTERGMYLFAICMVLTLLVLGYIIFPKKQNSVMKVSDKMHQEAQMIFVGNMMWILAFLVIFVAIIYPIYFSIAKNIDAIIDPGYYIKVFLPIFVPIILLAGFSQSSRVSWSLDIVLICLSHAVALYIDYVSSASLLAFLSLSSSIYLMLKMIVNLWFSSQHLYNVSLKKISLFCGHFGFGLLVFSIVINNLFLTELKFSGAIGDQIASDYLSVKLQNIKFATGENYFRQIAEFEVQDKSGNIVILKPENRLYKIEKTLSQEVDIFSFLTHDLYAVIGNVRGKTIGATIYYQPMISLIWFSAFLIGCAFLLLLFDKFRTGAYHSK